jgi:ADP-ribosyl-[dinitrogen reductase] hydrolase
MLLEIAIFDAYGACFEGSDLGHIIENNDVKWYHNEEPGLVKPGAYTDDTQMSIAVAEALLDGIPWTKEALADKFVETFHRDVRRGYTGYFFMTLLHSKNGAEMLSKIDGKSEKSGAAMRSGVLGLLPDVKDVVEYATIQAQVTHDCQVGIDSSILAALMVHYFEFCKGEKKDLSAYLRNFTKLPLLEKSNPDCWQPGKRIRSYAWDCIESAVCAIEKHDSLRDILHQIVQWSGDVDTAAAIAAAAACRSEEIQNDLPQRLYDDLENGQYGRDYLIALDERLRKHPNLGQT